jgi:hypothetical protein
VNGFIVVLRWLAPVAWVFAGVVAVSMLFRIVASMPPAGRRLTPELFVIVLAFVSLALWSVRMAYKEFREALNARPLPPPLPRWQPPLVPPRYPLREPLRAELLRTIELLEVAGMLEPGEVSRDELIACAEHVDDFEEMDIVMVAHILHALREERGTPFDHLAFFADQVETTDDDPLDMVRELARLSGHGESVRGLRMRMTGAVAPRGKFPPPNAVVEFELGAQAHAVPFVMYGKNAPGGLTEGLARVFTRADDPRRFFDGGFDSFSIVTYLAPAKIAELNAALAPDATWAPVLPGSTATVKA